MKHFRVFYESFRLLLRLNINRCRLLSSAFAGQWKRCSCKQTVMLRESPKQHHASPPVPLPFSYSRYPGFHQRKWRQEEIMMGVHLTDRIVSFTSYYILFISSVLAAMSRMQIGCTGEIQLWEVPNDLHKISQVPDWHMKNMFFPLSLSLVH